jgi:hypothetical protein
VSASVRTTLAFPEETISLASDARDAWTSSRAPECEATGRAPEITRKQKHSGLVAPLVPGMNNGYLASKGEAGSAER